MTLNVGRLLCAIRQIRIYGKNPAYAAIISYLDNPRF